MVIEIIDQMLLLPQDEGPWMQDDCKLRAWDPEILCKGGLIQV